MSSPACFSLSALLAFLLTLLRKGLEIRMTFHLLGVRPTPWKAAWLDALRPMLAFEVLYTLPFGFLLLVGLTRLGMFSGDRTRKWRQRSIASGELQ